jgi:hypothetical protein
MENMFEKHTIRDYSFDAYFNLNLITHDLLIYICNNLENENYNILTWDLKNVLTTNANGEYI